ncbi:MAG: glycerate dehydrogenase [Candidatus Saccharibacteria bacterium]|nr:glycerate dehydrogenase [Candidatus Saccharibacteria bacterium]
MKIVIPDKIAGVPDKYWEQLRAMGAEVYTDSVTQAEATERVKNAEIITVNYFDGDKDLIDAAPNLKYIIAPAVGYEWIDTAYAASKGIKVLNCPTFVPVPVAEHAMAFLLALAKHLPEARADMQSGEWSSNKYVNFELAGKKLGLLGYGNIGKNIERMTTGFGMTVSYTNSKSTPEQIDQLFQTSDVVCLCLPLTSDTHHMVDARRLKLLKQSAYLINVARGAIIDQAALLEALKQKQFAGAGMDVFEDEPGASGEISPQIAELLSLPNVVATPHSAFNTPEALDRKGAEIVANVQACLDGAPVNVVNG